MMGAHRTEHRADNPGENRRIEDRLTTLEWMDPASELQEIWTRNLYRSHVFLLLFASRAPPVAS